MTTPNLAPIVDEAWLLHVAGPVILADVRWYLDGRSGLEAYEAAHLPGAVFVDLDRDLARSDLDPTEGRHPLPAPEHFADAMAGLGIGDDAVVVAYDDTGGMTAGRLVVMLRMLGRSAALLDGGLAAWSGPLEQGPAPRRERATFTVTSWPADRLATADDIAALAADPRAVVLDARSGDRYRGEAESIDPRPGHIPGAVSAPWQEVIDTRTGRLRDRDELRRQLEELGVAGADAVVAYCGSGVSACVDLLAIEHAGLPPGRLYVASWSGWSADPRRPAETG